MIKRIVAGVFAGVLAGTCLVAPAYFDPVPVHADFGDLSGSIDYIFGDGNISIAGIAGGPQVAAGLWAIDQAVKHPITAGDTIQMSSISVAGGYYSIGDGNTYFASVLLGGDLQYSGSDGGLVFAEGEHFRLKYLLNGAPSQAVLTSQYIGSDLVVSFSGAPGLQVSVVPDKGDLFPSQLTMYASTGYFDAYFRMYGQVADLSSGNLANYFARSYTYISNFLGNVSTVTMPAGDFDPSNPYIYIENTFRPWVQTYYPDAEPLLPDQPWTPEYPSETIVGIPKDWTITNPQLPTSPTIDFVSRDADFSMIDPSETVDDYSSAFDFWWWLISSVLDETHFKTIVLLFVGLGVVSYILWKVGR